MSIKALCHKSKPMVAYGRCLECVRLWVSARKPSERYGASVAEVMAMLEKQGYVCAICSVPFGLSKFVIHHDHVTNLPHSLLHATCNSGIGMLLDSAELCERAAYVIRNPSFVREDTE